MAYKRKVKNITELEKVFNQAILASMKEIGAMAEKDLIQQVKTQVYGSGGWPSSYQRTGQLGRSVTKDVYQVGSFTNAEIFHDVNKMSASPPSYQNNRLGQYYSTVKSYFPQDYRAFVPQTINDGTSGLIFGTGPWTRPRPYFTTAKARAEKFFKRDLTAQLKQRGFNIVQ